jgi:hypothetical protein
MALRVPYQRINLGPTVGKYLHHARHTAIRQHLVEHRDRLVGEVVLPERSEVFRQGLHLFAAGHQARFPPA